MPRRITTAAIRRQLADWVAATLARPEITRGVFVACDQGWNIINVRELIFKVRRYLRRPHHKQTRHLANQWRYFTNLADANIRAEGLVALGGVRAMLAKFDCARDQYRLLNAAQIRIEYARQHIDAADMPQAADLERQVLAHLAKVEP